MKKILIMLLLMIPLVAAYQVPTGNNIELILESPYTVPAGNNIELQLVDAGGEVPVDPCDCSTIISNSGVVDLSENCVIDSNCDLGSLTLSFINDGQFTCDAIISGGSVSYTGLDENDYIKLDTNCYLNME